MICKWAGAVLVLFSGTGMGVWLAWQWKGRLRVLETLRRMVYFLKGEIVYSHAPLEEALERVGKREAGFLGALFTAASQGIHSRQGESFQEIWSDSVKQMEKESKCLLTQEDLNNLSALGEHLGYLDVDMQERTLLLYLEQLDLTIGELRSQQKERCRLYTSLGVMGGMFLVIMMY